MKKINRTKLLERKHDLRSAKLFMKQLKQLTCIIEREGDGSVSL